LYDRVVPENARTRPAASRSEDDAIVDDLERILVGAVGLTTQALSIADPGFELTFPQWRALLVVGEEGDGARISEVATRVGVTVPATSRMLRRLERRGLVILADDDLDRRATRARLTGRGERVRGTILGHRRAVLRELVAATPSRERTRLQTSLRPIAEGLERFA
jgi:DNA-binding MarR family transcriptional regulator